MYYHNRSRCNGWSIPEADAAVEGRAPPLQAHTSAMFGWLAKISITMSK